MLKNLKLFGVLLAAMILSLCTLAEAAPEPDWNANKIQVTGMGVAPRNAVSPAHASMMARRAAIADGYRQLAEVIQGVQVDAETTVEQMMLKSDVVKTKVSTVVKGAQIVSEGELAGGGYSVTMEIPLFGGNNSLANAVIERTTVIEPFPAPAPDYVPPTPPAPSVPSVPSAPSVGKYTGLIVDCRGVGSLRPVMSPVILDANMKTIYGHKNLDCDKIIREGMASYAHNQNDAVRAGSNPLVVRAIGIDDLNADPILSMEDTNLVLYENETSHFLDNTAVVFLY